MVVYRFEDFELDAERLELRKQGTLVKADALVLRLLAVLVQNAGRLVTKEELASGVWQGRAIADNAITVSMARLRKALGEQRGQRELITTVYGRGYRFAREVVARPSVGFSPAPSVTPRQTPPFVGREPMLQRLLQLLARARTGEGSVALLLGEAGIGKTRLIEEFARSARAQGALVAWGYGRQAGDTPPLEPWLRLLGEVSASGSWDSEFEQRLNRLAREVRALVGEPTQASTAAASAAAQRHSTFEAITRGLTRVAEHTRCVLVLDDLHRADAASIELLSYMLDEIARTPLLIVASVRHTEARPAMRRETTLPHVLGHRNSERLIVPRLRPEDVAAYVAAEVGDDDSELAGAIFDKSEGNPFFMTELARSVRSSAHVGRGSRDALHVPGVALELLRQRIGALEPPHRDVLAAAAVIGRSFELPLLADVLQREPSELIGALDEAIAEDIVVAAPDSSTAFTFGHALQRTVLRESLPAGELRSLHLRVVRALERKQALGEVVPASELAYHSHAALPVGNLRAVVAHCRAAADAAAAVFAVADILRYTRNALEALDLMPHPSARLRMGLCYQLAAFSRGVRWQEVERATRELERLARAHADGQMLTYAACMMSLHPELRPLPGARAAADQALTWLPERDAGFRALALGQLACAPPHAYQRGQAGSLIRQAAALAQQSGQRDAVLAVLMWRAHLEGGPDHGSGAEVCAQLEQATLIGVREVPVAAVALALVRSSAALQHGKLDRAEEALAHASSIARVLNHGELEWHAARGRALLQLQRGTLAQGSQELAQLHRAAQRGAIHTALPMVAFDRVVFAIESSQTQSPAWAGADALAPEPSDPPGLWALRTHGLVAAGRLDQALAALSQVPPEQLAELPCDSHYLATLGHLTHAALRLAAHAYLEPLRALLARYPSAHCASTSAGHLGATASLLGRLELALGRKPEAITHLREGLSAELEAGFSLSASYTRLVLDETRA